MEKEKKRNRKLLVQVGVVFAVLFLVMIIITATMITTTMTVSYASIFEEYNTDVLLYVDGELHEFDALPWLFHYWEEHILEMGKTDEDTLSKPMAEILAKTGHENCRQITTAEAEDMSNDEQAVFAEFCYNEMARVFRKLSDVLPVERQLCVVPNGKGAADALVIFAATKDGSVVKSFEPGDLIPSIFAEDKYEAQVRIDTNAAQLDSPVAIDEDTHALLIGVVPTDNIRMNDASTIAVAKIMRTTILCLVGIGVLLIIFIYFQAVRPLAAVKKSMRRYQEEKNAEKTLAELEKIRTRNEVGVLAVSFSDLVSEMERHIAEVGRLAGEKERISTELNVATTIQADMLPKIFPAFPEHKEVDIYAAMDPAKEVGGDFYDFYRIDDDHIALTIADVSGKGVPAALFMVIAKTILKNRTLSGGTPAEILTDANNQLCEGNESGLFVTVWHGILTLSTGDLICANAGHENPAMRFGDGGFQDIKTKHGALVGLLDGISYTNEEYHLESGDALFVYTDGVPEATNANEELYSEERLFETLSNLSDENDPKEILRAVRQSVDEFVGDAPQFDDLTMLVLIYKK